MTNQVVVHRFTSDVCLPEKYLSSFAGFITFVRTAKYDILFINVRATPSERRQETDTKSVCLMSALTEMKHLKGHGSSHPQSSQRAQSEVRQIDGCVFASS